MMLRGVGWALLPITAAIASSSVFAQERRALPQCQATAPSERVAREIDSVETIAAASVLLGLADIGSRRAGADFELSDEACEKERFVAGEQTVIVTHDPEATEPGETLYLFRVEGADAYYWLQQVDGLDDLSRRLGLDVERFDHVLMSSTSEGSGALTLWRGQPSYAVVQAKVSSAVRGEERPMVRALPDDTE